MNVKKGDLAVVVDSLPAGTFLIGRFVEVLSRAEDVDIGPAWWIRLQSAIKNPINGDVGSVGVAADAFLRPIRPQSDDAQDEMLLIAGKPNEVTA